MEKSGFRPLDFVRKWALGANDWSPRHLSEIVAAHSVFVLDVADATIVSRIGSFDGWCDATRLAGGEGP